MDHSAPSGHQVDIVEMLSSQVKDISLKKQVKRKGPKHEQNKNRLIEHLQKLSEDELALIVAKRSIKKCSEGMATGFNTPKFYSEKFNQFLNRVKESPDESKKAFLEKFKSTINHNQCTRIAMGNMIRYYRDNATGEVEKKKFKISYSKKNQADQLVQHTRINCPHLLELFSEGLHYLQKDENGHYYMSETSLQQVLGLTLLKSTEKKIDFKIILLENGFEKDSVTKRFVLDNGNRMRCVLVTGDLSRRILSMQAVLRESMPPKLFHDLETRFERFEKIKNDLDPSVVQDETLMVLTETCFQFICSLLFKPQNV